MNTENGALDFEALLKNDRFLAAIQQNNRAVNGMTDNFVTGGKKIDLTFGGLSNSLKSGLGQTMIGLIGPITGVAVALKGLQVAKAAYDFENEYSKAMREVQTISKAVQEDIDGIKKRISDMAANGADDAIKLTKAFYQIVSAGYDGEQGLKLLEVASKSATAGLTETVTAADGITTVLNAWGLGVEQSTKVADIMFKTVERGKTTFGELASNIAQVAPLAAANNIEFEQIFAAIQSITKQGVPTAQAMTQIRSSIINLNKVLGDGWSDTMTYQEGLNRVAEMAGGSQNKLKELIPDVEGVNAVLALTGEKAKGAADDLNETAKAVGAMESAHSKMMLEADNKWSQVYNKWTREIGALGSALKSASGNLADFLNTLLTDTQADIIDPGAKKIVDGVSASITGLESKEEKLTAVLAKINELRNARIGDLNPQAAGLEGNLPGWVQRQVENVNAGIGLGGKTFTPGRYTQAELEYVNNQIEISKQAEKELLRIFTAISEGNEKTVDSSKQVLDTVSKQITDTTKALAEAKATLAEYRAADSTKTATDIQTQIDAVDALQKKLETLTGIKADPKKEVKGLKEELDKLYKDLNGANEKDRDAIAKKIVSLEDELELRKAIAEAALKAAENDTIDPRFNLGSIRGRITGDDGKDLFIGADQVKKIDKVNLEFDKLNKRLATTNKEAKEGQQSTLDLSNQIMGVVNDITQKYAEQLGLNEDQAKVLNDGLQAMSGIADIASGNILQGAAKLADSMLSMFLQAPEKLSDHFVHVQEQVEKILNSIDIATRALSNLNVDSSLTSIAILKSQLTDLADEAQRLNEELAGKYYGPRDGDRAGSTVIRNIVKQAADLNDEIEKLSNRLLEGGISDDQRKAIEAVLESYNSLMSALDSTIEGIIGTSVSSLRNSLVDAFFEAEDAATAWGDTVNDVIANIAKNQLISKLLTEPVNTAVNDLLNSFSDGDLSTADIEAFQNAMKALYESAGPAFEEAIKGLEDLGIEFGSSESSYKGLTGSIQRNLTEETGSELAGLWRKTSDDTRQIRDYSREALNNLVAIQFNTANTVAELQNAVTELKAINTNTKPVSTSRDLGV